MAEEQAIRINKPLTNISVAYRNEMFIADKVLPRVVENRVNPFYYTWDRDNFRMSDDRRAPGAKANEVTFNLNKSANFTLTERTLVGKIPKESMEAAKDADSKWDLKRDEMEFVNDKILTRYEKEVADLLFNATTFAGYTSAITGVSRWDQYGTSDPVDDIDTARASIRQSTGIKPNMLILGAEVFVHLANHPDILDRIKGGATKASPADVTAQVLAIIFKVNEVIVGDAVYDSASEGGTVTMTDLWGKYALLAYKAPKPKLKSPSVGYTFYNTNYEEVRDWYNQEYKSHFVEVTKKFEPKVVSAMSGYLYQTVVS